MRRYLAIRAELAALVLLILPLAPSPAFPAAGDLDPTFSGDGLVQVGFGQGHDGFNAIAAQADGKTVSVGFGTWASDRDWVIARNEVDGSRDVTFGNFGWVRESLSTSLDVAYAVLVQPDGKIVVGGESNGQFAVMRLNTDGTPDGTFAVGGLFRHGPAGGGQAWVVRAMALQGTRIILFGKYLPGLTPVAVTMRLNANGTVDGSFGSGGLVTTSILTYGEATSGLVMPDSRILVGGWGADATNRRAVAALRYQANGAPDLTWATTGQVTRYVGTGSSEAFEIAYLTGGTHQTRVALAGRTDGLTGKDALVVMYNDAGAPLGAFGTGGARTYPVASGDDAFVAMTLIVDALGNPSVACLCGSTRINNSGAFQDALVARIDTMTGTPDVGFDGDGFAIVAYSGGDDSATDIILAAPDKLILGGLYAQAGTKADAFLNRRSRATGANDASYYVNGIWNADYGDAPSRAVEAAVRPDGKIWVAGNHDGDTWDIALVRLHPDGTLDDALSYDGKLVHNGNGHDYVNGMALYPDGRVLVCGSSQFPASDDNFMLARFLEDGSWDPSFDGDGWLVSGMDLSGPANDVLVQPDGRIVGVGYAVAFGVTRARVTRFLDNGAVDITFNGTGHNVRDYDSNYTAWNAVARQSNGKLVMAGFRHIDGIPHLMVGRFNTDGTLDGTFGGGAGYVYPMISPLGSVGQAVAIRPDGRILVTGQSWSGAGSSHTVVRFLSNGSLDTSFDGDGIRILSLPGGDGVDMDLVLDPAGRMYLAGSQASLPAVTDWSLLRMFHDGTMDTQWSGDGVALVPHQQLYNARAEDVVLDGSGRPIMVGQDGEFMAIRRFDPGIATSSVPEEEGIPSLRVASPWPNPARLQAAISFELAEAGPVRATIFDVAGRRIRTLADAPRLDPGRHDISWDLRDDTGREVAAGIYLVRVKSEANSSVRRITVAR
ncbi:MAG TPA: FlgD immunoglobulin-like domain containing protein [Candidatus Eisenbacteria bacterium]